MRAYFTGNLYSYEAIEFMEEFEDNLNFEAIDESEIEHQALLNLGKRIIFCKDEPSGANDTNKVSIFRQRDINEQSQNHLTFNYYQGRPETIEDSTKFQMLSSFLMQTAFRNLRTEHKLGYVAFAGTDNKDGILNAYVCVQGNAKTPDEVDMLIE